MSEPVAPYYIHSTADRVRNTRANSLLLKAVSDYDCLGIAGAVELGADSNCLDPTLGLPPLLLALVDWHRNGRSAAVTDVRQVARLLLDRGANPNYRGAENCCPVFIATLLMDAELLTLLLNAGADPNFRVDSGESLYDYAEFDYRHEDTGLGLPLSATDGDRACADASLRFLYRRAEKLGVKRPDHVRVLRSHGATTAFELRESSEWARRCEPFMQPAQYPLGQFDRTQA